MHHLVRRTLIGGLALAAAGAPAAAQARPMRDPPASHTPASQPVAVAQPSFQWGDAGIGAAGALVLLTTGAAAAAAVHRRGANGPMERAS